MLLPVVEGNARFQNCFANNRTDTTNNSRQIFKYLGSNCVWNVRLYIKSACVTRFTTFWVVNINASFILPSPLDTMSDIVPIAPLNLDTTPE